MDSNSEDEFFDCQSEPLKYYAVACLKDKGKGLVTTDINEARNKLKSSRGSRFSSFYDPIKAKLFSESPLTDSSDNEGGQSNKKKSIAQKKVTDPFPTASPRDLNVLKVAIESGNLEKVKQVVWNNPRHLVTESDSPTLLHSRFRYNAIHVAVSFNQPEVAEFILDTISHNGFWQSIYPTAEEICNKNRMKRVLDMYLNSPEIGNLETPLHLAAKFGNKECLRILLKQELTDTNLRNTSNLLPIEVACNRYTEIFKEQRIQEIVQIFSEKYVVLLEYDGGKVLDPMSHCQLLNLLRQRNTDFQFTPVSAPQPSADDSIELPSGYVRAYIGPLEELKARQLFCRWSELNAEDANKFEKIRRSDAEKGMENHGRYLASLFGAPWRELWQFLGVYTDFGSDEGLKKLEKHLEKVCNNESSSAQISEVTSLNSELLQDKSSGDGNGSGMYNSLIRIFSRLTLQSGSVKQISSPINHFAIKDTKQSFNFITSTPVRPQKNSSLRIKQKQFNLSLNGEGILTATDRQVREAILSSTQKNFMKHQKIISWLQDLSEVDPQPTDLKPFHSFNGFVTTSTPIKSNIFKRPQNPTLLRCLSPLSQIELAD